MRTKRIRTKVIMLVAALAASLLLGGCASCDREWKTIQSDIDGGIDRTVTLYDYNGEIMREWSGKFDLSYSENETFFDDQNGRRVIIHGGIVVSEEN